MAPSTAEVGAVITELENEYQRSKKFVENLYRTLETRRLDPDTRPGECLHQSLQMAGTLHADAKEAAVLNPFAMFQLSEEDSEMSNSSEVSTSVPRLPDLRFDGNIPSYNQQPGYAAVPLRREDTTSAMPSSFKRKNVPLGTARKPSVVTYNSCPNVESSHNDDFLNGAFDGYLQTRASYGVHGLPSSLTHVEGSALAQILTSTPPLPSGVRHRRSSLDFIPAPPPHMRKWPESTLSTCSSVPATGQEALSSRPQQPAKRGSGLEILGNSATAPSPPQGPLASTSSSPRPTYMGPPHRRLSYMSYAASPPAQQATPHSHDGLSPAVPNTAGGSPSPTVAGGSAGVGMCCSTSGHLNANKAVPELGVGQLTITIPASPGASSPSYLPPLQPVASSPAGPVSVATGNSSNNGGGGGSGGGITVRSPYSSLDLTTCSGGSNGGRMGSWSGVPLQGPGTSGSSSGGEGHGNPTEQPRTARFTRRGLTLTPAAALITGFLTPTPPSEPDWRRDRPRRAQGTAGDGFERRPSSLAPLGGPSLHVSCTGSGGSAERLVLVAGDSTMSPAAVDNRLTSEPAVIMHYSRIVGVRPPSLQQSCSQPIPVSVGRLDACVRRPGVVGSLATSRVG